MATANISELAHQMRAAIAEINESAAHTRAGDRQNAADLCGELEEAVRRLHGAVADAEAFIDISSGEPLAEELQEVAALGAAALFIGRRLFESNAARVAELHPELATTLDPAIEIARLLGSLSDNLLEAIEAQHRTHHDVE